MDHGLPPSLLDARRADTRHDAIAVAIAASFPAGFAFLIANLELYSSHCLTVLLSYCPL
jgi:hypothetical protein